MKKEFPISFALYFPTNNGNATYPCYAEFKLPLIVRITYTVHSSSEYMLEHHTTEKFSNINIFVGENNAGKSRFMREFVLKHKFILNSQIASFAKSRLINLLNLLSATNQNIPYQIDRNTFQSLFQIIGNTQYQNKDIVDKYLKLLYELYIILFEYQKYDELFPNAKGAINKSIHVNLQNIASVNPEIKQLLRDVSAGLTHFSRTIPPKASQKIYIPTLRTLNTIGQNDKQAILHHVAQSYQLPTGKDGTIIFSGETFYEDVKKLRDSSSQNDRDKLDEFCYFLSNNFFPEYKDKNTRRNKHLELIPSSDGVVVVSLGNERDRKVYDLGDGIQQMILLMFKIFTCDDNAIFCIEEPETYLHPAYQRLFLETLLNNEYIRSKNLVVFFTTHSNHLLDIALTQDNEDIAIFKFTRNKADNTSNMERVAPADPTLLEILGVQNTSVFLTNKIIWVEGKTDVEHLRAYLKVYCDKEGKTYPKEYLDYSFMIYGGCPQLKNYLEIHQNVPLPKILKDNLIVTDGDFKDQEVIDALKAEMGDRFYRLPAWTIENLLPPDVLLACMKSLGDLNQIKSSDWEGLVLQQNDYLNKPLNEYLIQKLKENGIEVKSEEAKKINPLELQAIQQSIVFFKEQIASKPKDKNLPKMLKVMEEKESKLQNLADRPPKILNKSKGNIAQKASEILNTSNISQVGIEAGKKLYGFICSR